MTGLMRKSDPPAGMSVIFSVILGIYQGLKDFRTYYPLDVADVRYQDAEENGLWYPFKKVGDMIQEGDILGEVRDYEGNVKEVSVAEFDGVLLYQCGTLAGTWKWPDGHIRKNRQPVRRAQGANRKLLGKTKRQFPCAETAGTSQRHGRTLDERNHVHSFRKEKICVFLMWDVAQDFSLFCLQKKAIR